MFIDDLKSFKKEPISPTNNETVENTVKNDKFEVDVKNETKTPNKSNKRTNLNTQSNEKLIFSSKKKKSKISI
jgi:hypothetical protein